MPDAAEATGKRVAFFVEDKMFKITMGKGFLITFENGYTVSVQWGPGTYSDNHMAAFYTGDPTNPRAFEDASSQAGEKGSKTAEVAVFNPAGKFINPDTLVKDEGYNDGYQTPAEVLELMNRVSRCT